MGGIHKPSGDELNTICNVVELRLDTKLAGKEEAFIATLNDDQRQQFKEITELYFDLAGSLQSETINHIFGKE